VSKYRKFWAAAVAALGVIVEQAILHGQAQEIATTVLAVAGAVGVYLFPNDAQEG
jgi:outer membrane lipoprotein SlyB